MKLYYFVGSEAEVNGVRLERLGQTIQLEETNGLPLVPEEAWKATGITKEDLDKYGHHTARENAPYDFLNKLRKAWAAVEPKKPSVSANAVAPDPKPKKGDK